MHSFRRMRSRACLHMDTVLSIHIYNINIYYIITLSRNKTRNRLHVRFGRFGINIFKYFRYIKIENCPSTIVITIIINNITLPFPWYLDVQCFPARTSWRNPPRNQPWNPWIRNLGSSTAIHTQTPSTREPRPWKLWTVEGPANKIIWRPSCVGSRRGIRRGVAVAQ